MFRQLTIKQFVGFLVLFLFFYYTWLAVFSTNEAFYMIGISLFNTTALFTGFFWLFIAIRQSSGVKKGIWSLVALSYISLFVGSGYYVYAIYTFSESFPYPNIGDAFTLLKYVLLITAMILLVWVSGKGKMLKGYIFNIFLLTSVILTLVWPFYVQPVIELQSADPPAMITSLSYQLVTLSTLIIAISLLFLAQFASYKAMMVILSFGLLFNVFGDVTLAFSLTNEWYLNPVWYHHLPVPLYAIGWLLIGYAGFFSGTKKFDDLILNNTQKRFTGNLSAYASVLILVLIYFYNQSDIIRNALVIILLIIVMRQYFVMKENRRLNDKLELLVNQKTKDLQKALTNMEHIAKFDHLTGLPNRRMILLHLENMIEECRLEETFFAVMFIDMDRFKTVNDTLGHEAGDELLKQVSGRLKDSVRNEDIIGRYGGDEFIILLKDVNEDNVIHVANRMKDEFSNSFDLSGKSFYTTPSTGIAMFPKDATSGMDLIQYADIAMYDAKTTDGLSYRFYSFLSTEVYRKITLEKHIRSIKTSSDLSVVYQPVFRFDDYKIIGFEGLMRWNNKELGNVPPVEFIEVAEETGMIIPMGKWILLEVCHQIQIWNEYHLDPIQISVNVSNRQLYEPGFVEMVRGLVEKYDIQSGQLLFEITEKGMHNIEHMKQILYDLKKMGVQIILDDFGKNQSSITLLNTIPIEQLKVDQSLLYASQESRESRSLILGILDLAYHLKLNVFAEGLEDFSHIKLAKELGFNKGQGYYFHKPMPIEDARILIKNNDELKV